MVIPLNQLLYLTQTMHKEINAWNCTIENMNSQKKKYYCHLITFRRQGQGTR